VLALPNQTPDLIERYGLTRADVERSAWVIDSDEKLYEGADAVNRILREWGGLWKTISLLYKIPIMGKIEDRLYRFIAVHRHRLSRWGVTPECDRPEVECQ
jgi:predicted DCC family thiol-disulfide oxidoreductase YuxK